MDNSDVTLSFRTWELLYIKVISQVVDEAPTEKPQAAEEVKRLVRSFLPRFPDECRLSNRMKIVEASRSQREQGDEDDDTRRLWWRKCRGRKGHSIWVNTNYFCGKFKDLGRMGITRVALLDHYSRTTTPIPVKICDFIPFNRFFEYFENVEYFEPEFHSDEFMGDYDIHRHYFDAWRKSDNTVAGIDAMSRSIKFFRQLNGTWTWGRMDAGIWNINNLPARISFMSTEGVENTFKSLMEKGVRIREYYD